MGIGKRARDRGSDRETARGAKRRYSLAVACEAGRQ